MRAGQVLRDPTSATIKRYVATDTLKIDRSFMMDLVDGPEGLALVSTIITLAHSLKLKVVAEGVETEEQSRLLRLLNIQALASSCGLPRRDLDRLA